jgi:CheY-like chemotaxis protein
MEESMVEKRGELPCVLVVDDEPDVRNLVCEILKNGGFQTVVADDGEDVLPLAAAHRPALIVLDIRMPGVDGYTALTRLRGDLSTMNIPVVVLTARPEPIYQTLSAGVGAAAHVTKPFSSRYFTETVRRVLGASDPAERSA